MPPRHKRLKCHLLFPLAAVVLLLPVSAEAQTGRVTMQARVSEIVTLSAPPNFAHGNVDAEVLSTGNTVRITLTSTSGEAPVIRVPLLVRSNSGFKISAAVESTTDSLAQLSITDVRATGTLVSPAAINGLNIPEDFDLEARNIMLVSGPRVSLGGTLTSPNNALQITVLIRLKPQPAQGSLVHLTFAAAPLTQ